MWKAYDELRIALGGGQFGFSASVRESFWNSSWSLHGSVR